jgi:hypothetical protein
MELERFDGHIVQLDYDEGIIRAIHLKALDGQRYTLTIENADDLEDIRADYSGPLAFLARDPRPRVKVRIVQHLEI